MDISRFNYMTDEMLEAHIKRLESLANTSEETDEYARLQHKLDEARTALALRKNAA